MRGMKRKEYRLTVVKLFYSTKLSNSGSNTESHFNFCHRAASRDGAETQEHVQRQS